MRVIILQTTLTNRSCFLFGSSLTFVGAVTRIGLFVNPTCRSRCTVAFNGTCQGKPLRLRIWLFVSCLTADHAGMEELRRFKASRKGYRTHVTRTLGKVTAVTESTEPITADQIVTLKTWLDQIEQKRAVLEDLDSKIANAIEEEDELTGEICEVEEYKIVLLERIALLKSFIASHESSVPSSPFSPAPQQLVSSSVRDPPANLQSHEPLYNQPTSENEQPPPTGDTSGVSENTHIHGTVANVAQGVSRLPKINLPYFSGDPLMWQTFWDSFNAAVHSNTSLTGVQKFNYLRAQLQGDAARVIIGFPLTDINYEQSIALLRERFGQPYKLINAHMQALLNLANVNNTLSSLQSLYDIIEGHVRGLASLGKHPESYGTMLTPVILSKLPKEIRKNIARDNNNVEWTLDDLRGVLLKGY